MLAKKLLEAAGNATQPNYIEDVFSTYLYTGTGANQTINNGLDESGKGALTWIKSRSGGAGHCLFDTARGTGVRLMTNNTGANITDNTTLTAFNSNGFSIGTDSSTNINASGETYVSWTFRKQPKFFDVVTYTGDGTSGRQIAHNLGSVPGCMIIKRTDGATNWAVYHRSVGSANYLLLNTTDASASSANAWNNTDPTSTVFTVGLGGFVNASGGTYVAYLFAHNAGGFGLTGTDNVISCGSYTGNGSSSGPTITLGYEPQWVLIKRTSGGTGDWLLLDTMRGITKDAFCTSQYLYPNLSNAESSTDGINILSTGFQIFNSNSYINANGSTYIYIAIRRGPMKVPTDATKVFAPVTQAGGGTVTTGFRTDLMLYSPRNISAGAGFHYFVDRLRGSSVYLDSALTDAEAAIGGINLANNTAVIDGSSASVYNYAYWMYQRAPSFFDEVCYTGTGVAANITHNLGVAPELMLVKRRDAGASWVVYSSGIAVTDILTLQSSNAAGANTAVFNSTAPTSSVFTVGTSTTSNGSGGTYVAYLFATCAGVSKVTSFTGNGSSQTINCGFTAGSRFVMIKRTDSTGDWYVWDSARGIVSGNDPHLSLNSTAAEVTTDDTIDTDSTGFIVNQVAATNCNVNGASYIVLAIA